MKCGVSATFAFFAALAVANGSETGCSVRHQISPLFTAADKSQILQYWNAAGRYSIGPCASAASRGTWQVRLSPEGSLYLWALNHGRKSAATLYPAPLPQRAPATPSSAPMPVSLLEQDSPVARPAPQQTKTTTPTSATIISQPPVVSQSPPADPGGAAWDAWIVRKIRHDRWAALQEARAANLTGPGTPLPLADRDTPEIEPDKPGVCPTTLIAQFGPPPAFAQAVQPKSFTIQFEDAAIQYEDNVKMNPRYAFYRNSDGVMSGGLPLKKFDPERLQKILDLAGCDSTKSHVMKAVSPLEGGFDSVNTYDTGFVSVGFIQFASLKEGAGSLGAVLLNYKLSSPRAFNSDFHRFGIDVNPDGTLDVLDPSSGEEVLGPEANNRIIRDKRLIAVFQRAGQLSDEFCAAQIRTALAQYYPEQDLVTIKSEGTTFTCKVCDLVHCESGMAMLFDRKVNTGNISVLSRQASVVAASHHCQNLPDLARYEKEIISGLKYRADFTLDPNLTQPGATSSR